MHINSDQIGFAAEAKVEQALKVILELQEQQKRPVKGLAARIKEFLHAKRHSRLDREHVDFLVKLETGEDIRVQVKSSERHAVKFRRMCGRCRLIFATVVVGFNDGVDSVVDSVIMALTYAYKAMRRRLEWQVHLQRAKAAKRSRKENCYRFHAPCMVH